MKQYLIFILLCLTNYSTSLAQIVEKENMVYAGCTYDVCIIKIDSFSATRFTILENRTALTEKKLFDSLSKHNPFFLINAGIVASDCNLLGLYIKKSQLITDINLADGNGNFFLKPNGFIGFSQNDISIMNALDYNISNNYITAVQNGPMLINNGFINAQFKKGSTNLNFRSGVGIYHINNDKYLVFAASHSPINFYDFANMFLNKFNCIDALFLEGGVNSSIHLPSSSKMPDPNKSNCKYLYFPL